MMPIKQKTAAILVALLCFAACSDDKNDDITPREPQEKNEYVTGIDLSKSYYLSKSMATFKDETFHALGYGYDITGKFAHPGGIRRKVIDPQKFEDDHYNDVMHHWGMFSHRGLNTLTGTKDEVKEQLLEKMKIESSNVSTEYKNAFKGVFDASFENDTTFTDVEYYYAVDAFASSWYEHYFRFFRKGDLLVLRDYLTDELKSDLESKSAGEVIRLYGTHVMVDIEVGWRQDYYFRATSEKDLQKRMVYASSKFLNSTPGIGMWPGPDEYYEKENLYSEYVSGVNPLGKPNAWMFDITNYDKELKFDVRPQGIDEETLVLVNWGKRSSLGPLIPIYEFISDESKRDALQKAYQAYLSE